MTATKPTVFIVDDDARVRDALRWVFESVDQPCKTFASGREFLDAFQDSQPGCLIADLMMPGMTGVELQAEMARCGIDLPIVFLTAHGDVDVAVHAMKAGAVDFMQKPFRTRVLLECVLKHAMQNLRQCDEREKRCAIRTRMASLSDRERQVMDALLKGHTSKTIGWDLGISPRTVDVHRARVLKKMGFKTVLDLVAAVGSVDRHGP